MLEVKDLQKNFGTTQVLKNVNLRINEGEVLGFLGTNGSGKTTTMRIIMGVLEPSGGEVFYKKKALTLKGRQRFGYMPEERGLYQNMNVGEQVQYFGRLFGMKNEQARKAANNVMERLDVIHHADKTVDKLSLGNQQRVQLAVALIHKPELLILDEPFSGLDPAATTAVAEALQELAHEGVGVLFSSHQLDLIEKMIDSVAILKDGEIAVAGNASKVRKEAAGPRINVAFDEPITQDKLALPPEAHVITKNSDQSYTIEYEGSPSVLLHYLSERAKLNTFVPQQISLREVFEKVVA